MAIFKFSLMFVTKYIKSLLLFITFASVCGLFIYEWTRRYMDCINVDFDDLDLGKYLIHNDKCKMPDISPYHRDAMLALENTDYLRYKPNGLVHLDRRDDKVFLVLGRIPVEISGCIACDVVRDTNSSVPDNNNLYINCQKFTDTIEMRSSVTDVKCFESKNRRKPIYQDVFANYIWKNVPQKVRQRKLNDHKPYNVVIIGIDSVSRLSFIRSLKKTYKFLLENDWVHFIAYNKVGENTIPNLVALLCGKTASYDKYKKSKYNSFFDKETFIWKNYSRLGYRTVFVEDHKSWGTFNNAMNGFKVAPTDFYFRNYIVAMENLQKQVTDKQFGATVFSIGGRIVGDRIFNLVTELPKACKDEPYFGFFWMNTFSHDDINTLHLMDKHIVNHMEDLQQNHAFNDTIFLFLSDHGMRMGNIRRTVAGSYEDRLPFLFVRVPDHFKDTHPEEYENLLANRKKLTSTFDLHMTLQHILALSKLNYTVKPAEHCPKCLSIFEELPSIRSCSEAGIASQYCACLKLIDCIEEPFTKVIAQYVVETIGNIIASHPDEAEKCRKLKFSRILHARIEEQPKHADNVLFSIALETRPKTTIEAILDVVLRNNEVVSQSVVGGPYRIDMYYDTGKCCSNLELKKFCYCHKGK